MNDSVAISSSENNNVQHHEEDANNEDVDIEQQQQCVDNDEEEEGLPSSHTTNVSSGNDITSSQDSIVAAQQQQQQQEVSPLPTWWSDSISATPSWKLNTKESPQRNDTGDIPLPDVEAIPMKTSSTIVVDDSVVEDSSMLSASSGGKYQPASSQSLPTAAPSEAPTTTGSESEIFPRVLEPSSILTNATTEQVGTTSTSTTRAKPLQEGHSVSFADSDREIQPLETEAAVATAPGTPTYTTSDNAMRLPPRHSTSLHTPPMMKHSPVALAGAVLPASTSAPNIAPTAASTGSSRLRIYKSSNSNNVKWVTREIAALDFLLGIPMQAEEEIVHQGWMQQRGMSTPKRKNVRSISDGDAGGGEEEKMEILEPHAVPSASSHGRWWEKWVNNHHSSGNLKYSPAADDEEELEQPNEVSHSATDSNQDVIVSARQPQVSIIHAPGRRLEGDPATIIQIPLGDDTIVTQQRSIARQAAIREWELRVAHGIASTKKLPKQDQPSQSLQPRQPVLPPPQMPLGGPGNEKPMLDGRMFFSASGSYPMGVYSLIRYEPKKEEAIRMRKKLEALGGGGTQFFVMPERDWRGISYRALLTSYLDSNKIMDDDSTSNNESSNKKRRKKKKKDTKSYKPTSIKTALSPDPKMFDRFATSSLAMGPSITASNSKDNSGEENEDGESVASISSSDDDDRDDTYTAGLLDDPDMVQGRHRTVMIGDRVTGCIVSSTIQFVKPSILKADLNKKFRDKFDGWEPPKSQHKFIGARVVDGVYTLMEPGGGGGKATSQDEEGGGSVSGNEAGTAEHAIRMPPSLTLSKIRSIKQQAVIAAVKAKLELGTVALAFIYFERLCLDCRVDKSNRRLCFAACLLLAIKINESHVALVMKPEPSKQNSPKASSSDDKKGPLRLQTLIKPTKKSSNMFATLLQFFTEDWSLSLKHLFAAEWGVFAALQFRLNAKPSQVAFHFKRLIKALGLDPLSYLGSEMFGYWQESLALEDYRRLARAKREEIRQQRKEKQKLYHLKRELHAASLRLKQENDNNDAEDEGEDSNSRLLVPNLTGNNPQSSAALAAHFPLGSPSRPQRAATRLATAMNRKILRGFGVKRVMSTDKLYASQNHSNHNPTRSSMSQPGSPSDHYDPHNEFTSATISAPMSLRNDDDDDNEDVNDDDVVIAVDNDPDRDVEEGIII